MSLLSQPPESGRPPQLVSPGLWLFAPSRDSQGGSSWLLEAGAYGGSGDLLVDAPGFTEANLAMLRQRTAQVGPGTLVLTSREGHGRCRRLQEALGWSGSSDSPPSVATRPPPPRLPRLMNKADLVNLVAARTELTKTDVSQVVDAAIETIIDSVVEGKKVSILGFGSFEPRERSARQGLNPKTGQKIKIPAKRVPAFTAGKMFKDRVQG